MRKLKSKNKIKDHAIHKFKRECRSFLATLCKHMVEKSPLQSLFARFTRALNPVYMAEKPESCGALFDKTLQKLVEYKQVLSNITDFAKQEFNRFLTLIVKAKKQTFCDFDFNASQLNVFFMRFLKDNNRYKNLAKIIKIVMTLSLAQRKVNDYMRKNNIQPHNMPL